MTARLFLLCTCLVLAVGQTLCTGAEPLKDIASVRRLSPDEGHKRLPVILEGVVTFYHDDWGVLFIHDGQDGICVGVAVDQRPKQPFVKGQRLRVSGVVGPGEFLPVIWPSTITDLGKGSLPANLRVEGENLFLPALDARPIEVEAVVKGTSFEDQSLVLDLQVDGWNLRAILPQGDTLTQLPWQLLERHVRVQGVAGTHFNDQRQMSGRLLFVPGLDSVRVEEDQQAPGEVPLLPVESLLRVDSPLRQRVRVQGQVTHWISGRGLYLRDANGSLYVQTSQPVSVATGDLVEAEGYPNVTAFRPSLSALNVKKTGTAPLPKPHPFDPAAVRNSKEQCELVNLKAELVNLTQQREGPTLTCKAGGTLFEALLPPSQTLSDELVPGMKLSLTGICELISTHPLVIPRNATAFRILLRSPEDIVITARQPWWTEKRARWLFAILAGLAVAVAAWAISLQVMVRRQSSIIRRNARQQATLEERQRIARDLHDTLEQELVGVNMLLDNTAMKMNRAQPEAAEPLGLARRLLRRAREESRSTIRELRSVTLEQRGLPAAMDELLRPIATAAGATFVVSTNGRPYRLPGTMETHLLRIGQEAVSNAARHSQATRIELQMHYEPTRITLAVDDDGSGFDITTTSADTTHFGLSGMKERADKIGGTLIISSSPDDGTTVTITAPVSENQRQPS